MIADSWDIAHIAVVVSDLERAMEEYSQGLGIEWAPSFDMPSDLRSGSDVHEGGVSFEGLSAVLPLTQVGPARMELIHTVPGSPASLVWGCPDGHDYVHHIAYYVEDIDAESAHLVAQGWEREWFVDPEGPLRMAYHRLANRLRVELVDIAVKSEMADRRKSVLAR
ncbi:MAG TPA: VOC family protein [Conexibacter sp.]|nr:VOC family protein [Conexibacter sp.]